MEQGGGKRKIPLKEGRLAWAPRRYTIFQMTDPEKKSQSYSERVKKRVPGLSRE